MEPMTAHVENLSSAKGVRVIVADDASDSLVTLLVTRRNGRLQATMGTRGNYDADQRPYRTVSTVLDAPDVSSAEREARKRRWFERNAWRFRDRAGMVDLHG